LKTSKINSVFDFTGIASAGICLVHCIATPILIALGASIFNEDWILYVFLILSFMSAFQATQNVINKKITIAIWASFWGFLFSSLLHDSSRIFLYISHLCSLSLIICHIANIRYCNKCIINQSQQL